MSICKSPSLTGSELAESLILMAGLERFGKHSEHCSFLNLVRECVIGIEEFRTYGSVSVSASK